MADGWLDLIITNDRNSSGNSGLTRYFANNHPNGVFSNFVEETSRLGGAGGAMCGGVALDLDQANGVDLFLGNYPNSSQDTFYLNDGSGIFNEVTSSHVPVESDYTVDVSAADLNGDNQVDLMICSHYDTNFICYNNLNNAGSGIGDFKYANSRQSFSPVDYTPFMEPGDFNCDGKNDIYYSNASGYNDHILINQGNDANGKATFSTYTVPHAVSETETLRVTVCDLNKDGCDDLIVMGEGRRPYILRNTSVGGVVSFIDWTPAPAFPNGSTLGGKHAAAFDSNGNGFKDILIGGKSNDHLFKTVLSNELDEDNLNNHELPALNNQDPIAVSGFIGSGTNDTYTSIGVPTGASVSVVLRSVDDLTLRIRDANGDTLATSDRGGLSVEEAIEIASASTNILRFDVILNEVKGDWNGNGRVDRTDFRFFQKCLEDDNGDAANCPLFDLDNNGLLDDNDYLLMKIRADQWQLEVPYVMEILMRD